MNTTAENLAEPIGKARSGKAAAFAWRLALFFVLAKLVLHIATHQRYGYFRDEFYYLACARHLDWSYVDHPPLVPLLLHGVTALFGDGLWALRIPATFAMCAALVLAMDMARRLGGGRFAQGLTGLAFLVSPAFLVEASILTVNPFDVLWWALIQHLLLQRLSGRPPALWLAAGAVLGLGLLTKYSIVFCTGGVLIGLLLTPARRELRTAWPYLAAVLALLLALPNIVWQVHHGWPTLEFLRNVALLKNYPVSPIEFAGMQFAVLHPFVFGIAMCGLGALLGGRQEAAGRPFGWAYLAVGVAFLLARAKMYYLFPAYPILLAAGGSFLERRLAHVRPLVRRGGVVLLAAGGIAVIPYTVPVLPLSMFLELDARLDYQRHIRFEKGRDRAAPIIYGDMLGWPELADAVAEEYARLPADPPAVVLAHDYGLAGAIEHFGEPRGLPPPVSGHNTYYLWGPGPVPWDTVLAVGVPVDLLHELFAEVTPVREFQYPLAREGVVEMHVCRGLRVDPAETWSRLKRYR